MTKLLFYCVLLCGVGSSHSAQAPAAGLPDLEWSLRGGNSDGQHFSTLDQISEASIARLGLAWYADIPSADAPVGTPIEANGLVYVVGTANIVFAHDVRSGRLRWSFDPENRYSHSSVAQNWGARIKRGVAFADGKIYVATGDCRLVAIDAKMGTKLWDARVCPPDDDYTLTAAPRVGGGMVLVAPVNVDFGTRRGYVDAYDQRTGRRLWRFYTIPEKGPHNANPLLRMASHTWDPDHVPAGGSAWEEISYDSVTGLIYIGVGGPSPWNPLERGPRRGDELFTNSIVAVEAKTGRYVWHFQTTPGDGWNLEPTMPFVLADLMVGGRHRRALLEAPKNGFFYALDARTGKLLNTPRNFVPVNWAKGVNGTTGKPIPTHDADYWDKPDGAAVSPSPLGAHGWMPMSYSPVTGLAYIPALELTAKMDIDKTATSYGGQVRVDMLYGLANARTPLIAWDPLTQSQRWTTGGAYKGIGGVLATAGNLVFSGAGDGKIRAFRASDGAELWSYDTGGTVVAAPVTVRIDGVQYLLLISGRAGTSAAYRAYPQLYVVPGVEGSPRLFAFRLDGSAPSPPKARAQAPFVAPPIPRPEKQLADRGQQVFELKGCDLCHGARAVALTGSVPDLRRATPATISQIVSIVRDGARSGAGMPAFGDAVTPDELDSIKAFLLNAAWDAYDAQSAADQAK